MDANEDGRGRRTGEGQAIGGKSLASPANEMTDDT